jgi:hypothetical protein
MLSGNVVEQGLYSIHPMEIHFNVDEINVSNKDSGVIDRCEDIANILEGVAIKYASTPLCRT